MKLIAARHAHRTLVQARSLPPLWQFFPINNTHVGRALEINERGRTSVKAEAGLIIIPACVSLSLSLEYLAHKAREDEELRRLETRVQLE